MTSRWQGSRARISIFKVTMCELEGEAEKWGGTALAFSVKLHRGYAIVGLHFRLLLLKVFNLDFKT